MKHGISNIEELYELAINQIKGCKGTITITIDGIPKISKSNDIIGNCVQEWIPQWLEDNGLELTGNVHTQQFPDFTANIDGKKYDMEVKCWNANNSPAFDLANFDGFYREIYKDPRKLNAKYLIFGYKPTTHGFIIDNIYLKNIWEITAPTKGKPINLQVKQGKPYAIRPVAFNKKPENNFKTRRNFVIAIQNARNQYPIENMIPIKEWLEHIEEEFKNSTGEDL